MHRLKMEGREDEEEGLGEGRKPSRARVDPSHISLLLIMPASPSQP